MLKKREQHQGGECSNDCTSDYVRQKVLTKIDSGETDQNARCKSGNMKPGFAGKGSQTKKDRKGSSRMTRRKALYLAHFHALHEVQYIIELKQIDWPVNIREDVNL